MELEDVSYRVAGKEIVTGMTAGFRTGAFNVIVGPNGAGKTTMLKLAAGHLEPSEGDVRYDGRAVAELDPEDLARRRAVLSQQVELAFALPVRSVVLMGRYPHFGNSPSARDREIVASALELVGMDDRAEQAYPTLSGGEQQKVQLARVLAQIWNYDDPSEPRLLFLDEPTTSLDVHFRIQILDTARELLDVNCTVVAILHDLNTAFEYGDAFFVLDEGRLVRRAERAADLSPGLLERVFGVRARRVPDPDGTAIWRFSL